MITRLNPMRNDPDRVSPNGRAPTPPDDQQVLILVADTNGLEFVADVDEQVIYIDHMLDAPEFSAAVARGALALRAGTSAVPGARRLNRHLAAVPDVGAC